MDAQPLKTLGMQPASLEEVLFLRVGLDVDKHEVESATDLEGPCCSILSLEVQVVGLSGACSRKDEATQNGNDELPGIIMPDEAVSQEAFRRPPPPPPVNRNCEQRSQSEGVRPLSPPG